MYSIPTRYDHLHSFLCKHTGSSYNLIAPGCGKLSCLRFFLYWLPLEIRSCCKTVLSTSLIYSCKHIWYVWHTSCNKCQFINLRKPFSFPTPGENSGFVSGLVCRFLWEALVVSWVWWLVLVAGRWTPVGLPDTQVTLIHLCLLRTLWIGFHRCSVFPSYRWSWCSSKFWSVNKIKDWFNVPGKCLNLN